MRKIPGQARGEIVPSEVESAREARLTYRTLGETPFGSWLEVELKTGRMHQIRLQSASRGHPVLGDVFYGAEATLGKPEPDPRRNAIALHGRRVCFRHPMTREQVAVTAPLPGHWNDLVLETHIAALEEA
jgi:23S rRNA pseudouridine1911/1915/1917 synthase